MTELLARLESAKASFRDAVERNGGKHGIWTADEYIAHWSDGLQITDLIERLERECQGLNFWIDYPER